MSPLEITHGEIRRVKIVIVRWIAGLIVTIFGWSIYWAVKVTSYINAKDNFAMETRRMAGENKDEIKNIKSVQYAQGIVQAEQGVKIDNINKAIKN